MFYYRMVYSQWGIFFKHKQNYIRGVTAEGIYHRISISNLRVTKYKVYRLGTLKLVKLKWCRVL